MDMDLDPDKIKYFDGFAFYSIISG